MTSVSGQCLCGQITVSIPKEVLDATDTTVVCYCKNCRQTSGSIGSVSVFVPESAIQITGQPKIYQDSNTDSGATVQRAFCSNCGSPIYSAASSIPGMKVVKLGLFDEIPKPSTEVYGKARPSWIKPIDGAKHFDGLPTK